MAMLGCQQLLTSHQHGGLHRTTCGLLRSPARRATMGNEMTCQCAQYQHVQLLLLAMVVLLVTLRMLQLAAMI